MLFKRKKSVNPSENPFEFRFHPYGDSIEDFIIFVGSANEEIQKAENMWVSWDVVLDLLNKSVTPYDIKKYLELELEKYVEEELKKRYGV